MGESQQYKVDKRSIYYLRICIEAITSLRKNCMVIKISTIKVKGFTNEGWTKYDCRKCLV